MRAYLKAAFDRSVTSFLISASVTFVGAVAVTLVAPFAHADLNSKIQRARSLKVADSLEWRRLLEMKPQLFGQPASLSKSETFFLAEEGATDADLELEATLRGFYSSEKRSLFSTPQLSLAVICQFPARFEFLNRTLDLSNEELPVKLSDCAEYQDFLRRLDLASVSLVFSSFYVGNPSSIYGHTFLKLEKKKAPGRENENELLDNGVNFSADASTTNPVLYALRGLTGGFDGRFAVLPFYYKVREYSDYESRDLWSYRLKLSSEELLRLQAHLWELGSTHFDYYYLTENCSYYILRLLEAAAPRLHLLRELPFWILPSDTLKSVVRADLVEKVQFRPSLHSQFEARLSKLSRDQKDQLRALVKDTTRAASCSDERVLDAALDLFDLKYQTELLNREPKALEGKQALLIARSKLPTAESLGDIQGQKVAPHLSHPSRRLGFGFFEDRHNATAAELQFRFAYHDFLDPQAGLPTTSEIQFFDFKFRYWTDPNTFRIENATVFGVTQMSPLRDFFLEPSWKLKFLAKRFDDPRCENCTGLALEGGYGLSAELGKKALFYTLAEADLETATGFQGAKFQPRLGALAGSRLRFTNSFAAQIEIKALRNFFSEAYTEESLTTRLRWVPGQSHLGFEVSCLWTTERQELGGSLYLYF